MSSQPTVSPDLLERADALTLETVLACYARDFGVGAVFETKPVHDAALAAALPESERGWLRLPFDASGVDVFCALTHLSRAGRHRTQGPYVVRQRDTRALRTVQGLREALTWVRAEFVARYTGGGVNASDRAEARIEESRDNLAHILADHAAKGPLTFESLDFLRGEQRLTLGHSSHPVAKGRWGWTKEELHTYSPEFGNGFALTYLLVRPDCLMADAARDVGVDALREMLLGWTSTPADVRDTLAAFPDWKVLPLHPWEAGWLAQREDYREVVADGAVKTLGTFGAPFYATSSVRTVFQPELPFSLKLSLHVDITNSARTNHQYELERGCAVTRLLLQTPWGEELAAALPWFRFMPDEAWAGLSWKGRMIPGTGVSFRTQTFGNHDKVSLLGAFCEPPVLGRSLLEDTIGTVALFHGATRAEAARMWLSHYLKLLFDFMCPSYERFGLALEIHAQNLLVELGEDGLPTRLHFRDNQAYFIREDLAGQVLRDLPSRADRDAVLVVPDKDLMGPFVYYLLTNNLFGLFEALSSQGLVPEAEALAMADAVIRPHLATDTGGLAKYLLQSPFLLAKANLRMTFEDDDEASRPVESPATYPELPNPFLTVRHPIRGVTVPKNRGVLYRTTFPEYAGTVEIRALDLSRDLEWLHRWVNADYAKVFWKNDGPIEDLELWYLEQFGHGGMGTFVGELDGKPFFVIETYWAPRDILGTTYPVRADDYGFHLLAGPPAERPPNVGRRAFQASLGFFFEHAEVGRVLGEPNALNLAVAKVTTDVGYVNHGTVQLPDKLASLIICTRENYLARLPTSPTPRALSKNDVPQQLETISA